MNWKIGVGVAFLLVGGCRSSGPAGVRVLPQAQRVRGFVNSPAHEITVRVVGKDAYRVGNRSMTGKRLDVLFATAFTQFGRIPVAIQAEPQTPFGLVWPAVRLASSNGCMTVFNTWVPGVDALNRLAFHAEGTVVRTANALPTAFITCGKDGIHLNDRALPMVELRTILQRLGDLSPDVPISISVGEHVLHQEVIDILDACEGARLMHRFLGLRKE